MKFDLDDRQVPDDTLLLFGVRYIDAEGRTRPKVWTYAALKAGGRWYFTGTGRVPQDAGWGAVRRWLDDPIREVVWVRAMTGAVDLWPDPGSARKPDGSLDHEAPVPVYEGDPSWRRQLGRDAEQEGIEAWDQVERGRSGI